MTTVVSEAVRSAIADLREKLSLLDTSPQPVPDSVPETSPTPKTFTAKQYAVHQAANRGRVLVFSSNGQPITSGSWVEYEGKPYLVYSSPMGPARVTSYRWVATRLSASRMPKETFTLSMMARAQAISDPTGQPYPPPAGTPTNRVQHGSLMKQETLGGVPSGSASYQRHMAESQGRTLGRDAADFEVLAGDWLRVDGKYVQVWGSPNLGKVAVRRWVVTKSRASTNAYDFPVELISSGVLDDPSS